MEIKFKKLTENAVIPVRAHKSDAGLDLTCTKITTTLNEARQLMLVYHTGLAVEIPEGYVGLLFPRSSVYKKSTIQTNCVGVIDSGYRGEIQAVYKVTTDTIPSVFQEGERFVQLVIVPYFDCDPVEAEELSESDRGEEGFGSTNNETISATEDQESHPEQKDESTNSVDQDQSAAGEGEVPPETVE